MISLRGYMLKTNFFGLCAQIPRKGQSLTHLPPTRGTWMGKYVSILEVMICTQRIFLYQ